MKEEAVNWKIKVSKETDLTVRRLLGAQAMKKGQLSKFIEQAVRWRVFHGSVQEIKARNSKLNPDELQNIVDHAVREVRRGRHARGRSHKI